MEGFGEFLAAIFEGGSEVAQTVAEVREEPAADDQPYVYERWLTRPRDPSVNDR